MTVENPELTLKKIAAFWLPLFSTWLMMGVEGPFIAAIIARLAQAKFNLAAFGVAFSLGMFFESPIIMMLSAANALVRDRQTYLKLRRFSNALNIFVTLALLLVLVPGVFFWLTMRLIGMPLALARLTRQATFLLLPWPAAIGYRRFYQGILIGNKMPRRVAYGTVVRLGSMAATALLLFLFSSLPGACVGTAALSAGVVMEALASRVMAGPLVGRLLTAGGDGGGQGKNLCTRDLAVFYFPLAMTSVLGLTVHPLMAFFLGKGRLPIESLAVLPVVNALVFIFRSAGLSFQEAAIALLGKGKDSYGKLRDFALLLGGAASGLLALLAFSPAATWWFRGVSGLSGGIGGAGDPAHPHLHRHPGPGSSAGFPARLVRQAQKHASHHHGHGRRDGCHRRHAAADRITHRPGRSGGRGTGRRLRTPLGQCLPFAHGAAGGKGHHRFGLTIKKTGSGSF